MFAAGWITCRALLCGRKWFKVAATGQPRSSKRCCGVAEHWPGIFSQTGSAALAVGRSRMPGGVYAIRRQRLGDERELRFLRRPYKIKCHGGGALAEKTDRPTPLCNRAPVAFSTQYLGQWSGARFAPDSHPRRETRFRGRHYAAVVTNRPTQRGMPLLPCDSPPVSRIAAIARQMWLDCGVIPSF